MPRPRRQPTFRELSREEGEALLGRTHVGRLAYSFHDQVDIEPIHFVYADGWIYGRTSHGTKLTTIAHNRWVAFETDEVDSLFEWRSVVVKGAVYLLEPGQTRDPSGTDGYERALELLRGVIPETLTEQDPTPHRTILFRVAVDSMVGREATRH